jgi:hypothetical protein
MFMFLKNKNSWWTVKMVVRVQQVQQQNLII